MLVLSSPSGLWLNKWATNFSFVALMTTNTAKNIIQLERKCHLSDTLSHSANNSYHNSHSSLFLNSDILNSTDVLPLQKDMIVTIFSHLEVSSYSAARIVNHFAQFL